MISTCCPRASAAGVAQALQRGDPGDTEDGGLLKGQVRRFAGQLAFARGGVFGERATADAEHGIAGREPGDAGAGRDNGAGRIQAQDRVFGCAQAAGQPERIRQASHEVPGTPVEAGRVDLDQHLVVADGGPVDLLDAQHLCGPVPGVRDRPHPLPPVGRRCRSAAVPGARHRSLALGRLHRALAPGGLRRPAGWPLGCRGGPARRAVRVGHGYEPRFLVKRFPAIESFSPSSGMMIHAAT